jgi:hypothetical protein
LKKTDQKPNSYSKNLSCCLLDTSYSKVTNDSKKIDFISIDNVNHNSKKSNRIAYEVYNSEIMRNMDHDHNEILHDIVTQWDGLMTNDRKKFLFSNLVIFKDIIQDENDTLLWFTENSFLAWYNLIKSKSRYIMFKKDDKKAIKKLICRYDPIYAKKIKNRMNWLMYKYGNSNSLLITLTLNPSNFRSNKKCMWETINILLKEFFDNLRIWYKKRNIPFPKYIRCIESMKGRIENDFVSRGNPHIHICLFGQKWLSKEIIDNFWPYGWTYIDSTAKGQHVRYPIHYITKYITKTYTTNDPNNTLNQSLVWFFNKNSYDHSKGLVYPLQKIGDGTWDIYYIVELDPLHNTFVEIDYIFKIEQSLYKQPPPKSGIDSYV